MTKEQLGSLIIASEDSLYRVAKTLLYSDADCADAIQESIVKAFSNVHTLRVDAYAKTWLIRILIHECYALLRRQKIVAPFAQPPQKELEEGRTDYSDLYEAMRK